ncbi:MAG: hypothetical protein J0M09_05595 [Xanthomonadales bacterium]|nr:hypothetical protein [Xanthomonadales bacterium]
MIQSSTDLDPVLMGEVRNPSNTTNEDRHIDAIGRIENIGVCCSHSTKKRNDATPFPGCPFELGRLRLIAPDFVTREPALLVAGLRIRDQPAHLEIFHSQIGCCCGNDSDQSECKRTYRRFIQVLQAVEQCVSHRIIDRQRLLEFKSAAARAAVRPEQALAACIKRESGKTDDSAGIRDKHAVLDADADRSFRRVVEKKPRRQQPVHVAHAHPLSTMMRRPLGATAIDTLA